MASIGYDGTDVSGPLGVLAVQLRDATDAIERRFSYIAKLGVAGLQAAPYNLAQADAQAMFDAYNNLHTLAAIYFGQAAQPSPYDFDDALALVRGGQ